MLFDRIPLHARFKLINQVMVPMFASGTDLEMPLVWQVPAGVKTVFAVLTKQEDDIVSVEGNWRFAGDRDNRDNRVYRSNPNLHNAIGRCILPVLFFR